MKYDLADRIRSRLDALGKNPSGVALEAGLGRSSVRDILLGRAANPRLDTLRKLTGPLQCTIDYLTGAADYPEQVSQSAHLWWMDSQAVGHVEKAEAGVFRRRPYQGPFDGTGSEIPASSVHVVYPDPRLVEWRYSLIEIADDSLIDLHIVKGDIATIARPFNDLQVPLETKLLVLSRRSLSGMDVHEISIREVEVQSDRILLAERCPNPAAPLAIVDFERSGTTILPNSYALENGSVDIEGVVVRVSRQIGLSEQLEDFSYMLR